MTLRTRIDELKAELESAQELLEGGQPEEARQKYEAAREQLEAEGLESAYVFYGLAETWRHERGQTPERALEALERGFAACCEAVRLDPIHPAHQEQFAHFGERLRKRLRAHGQYPNEAVAPRLYATLLRAGEADAACHVAMAEHLASHGQAPEALRILRATVLLEPSCTEAWGLLAELARGAGDDASAAEYAARAAALTEVAAPYGVPSPDSMC